MGEPATVGEQCYHVLMYSWVNKAIMRKKPKECAE